VIHFKKKNILNADNLLTPMSSRMSMSFFLCLSCFDENNPGFFLHIAWCTLLVTKRFKVQKTVSMQTVQRALKDSRRWIMVFSSETIAHTYIYD